LLDAHGMSTTLERCGVGQDLLHRVIGQHLDDFLARVQDDGRQLPSWVEKAFRAYLDCGQIHAGFAQLHCPDCDHHRIVPFSCANSAFCPSCCGRRMAERAAHWVDGVLPCVPVRQFVLSLPWARRYLLARDQKLCRGVLKVFVETVTAWYRERLELPEGRTGAIAVIQRFSSSLALNPHFHVLFLDGLYQRDAQSGELVFHPLPWLGTEDVEALVARVAEKAEHWLERRGHGCDDGEDEEPLDDAQQLLQAASLQGRSLSDEGEQPPHPRRWQLLGGRRFDLPPLCAQFYGYNLHAGTEVAADDRSGLERLGRYLLRPPLAKERLEEREDGMLVLKLRKPWSDGSDHLLFSPLDLLARLAALVPRPGKNGISYHGVLGARSGWRNEIVPPPPQKVSWGILTKEGEAGGKRRPWALPWADLLWRVFGSGGFSCPECGSRMLVRAIVLPPAAMDMWDGLRKSARDPPDPAEPQTAIA